MLLACYRHKHISYRIRTIIRKAIIGGVDEETGKYQGIQAFLSSESIIHVAPRILIAPQFTHQLPESENPKNPVVAALIGVAEKLRAII